MRNTHAVFARCRLCGSTETRVLFTRQGHAVIDLIMPYRFGECHACGVHFLMDADLPDDAYLFEKTHTRADAPDERSYVHWDGDVIARISQRVAPRGGARGRRPEQPSRLLDFGSGYGDMLVAATHAGYEATGFDVSPVLAAGAAARSGCGVVTGDLEAAPWEAGRFDVINAHFVLEYVHDPTATVGRLARLLAPGGVLRVCSYTTDSIAARLRGSRWWNYTPTRRFLYCERSLKRLANAAGLTLETVVHGGEQSLAHYIEEHPSVGLGRDLLTVARYRAERVAVLGFGLGSCTSFWLTRP